MTRSRPITFLASAAVIPLVASGRRGLRRRWRRDRRVAAEDLERGLGDSRRREWQPRIDPGQLDRPHLVSVQGRCRRDERVLGRVRDRVAAAAGDGQADRRHWTDRLQARNDHPLGRQPAGHLQRPPAVPVHQGQKARADQRAGRDGVRRRLVRADSIRKSGLRACAELGGGAKLRRRRWLLAKRPTPAQANRRSNHDKQWQ